MSNPDMATRPDGRPAPGLFSPAQAAAAVEPTGVPLRRTLLALCLAMMVPMLVFVGAVIWRVQDAENARIEGELLQAARAAAGSIDRELSGLSAALEVLASSTSLEEGDIATFAARARRLAATKGFEIVLRAPDGQHLVNTRVPEGEPLPFFPLAEFDAALAEAGRPIVSDVFVGRIAQQPLYALEMAVRDAGGEVRYLLGLSLPATHVQDILMAMPFPAGWVVGVVDGADRIVARNREHARFVGTEASADLRALATGREGLWSGTAADGREVRAAYSRTNLADWRVAVGVPREALVAPVWRSLSLTAALGAILSLLSFGLAWAFGRRIVGAVSGLRRQARLLGQGAPVSPVATGLREVDEVGREVAAAARALRERTAALAASEAHARAISDNLPAGFVYQLRCALDGSNREFVYVSEGCEAIAGVPSAQVLGDAAAMYAVVREEDRARLAAAEAEAIANRTPLDQEIAFERRGEPAGPRWVRIVSAPRPDPEGGLIWDGLVIDVTEARRAQEALRELSETLEGRVRAAVAEREEAEGQVRQMQKLEAVGQLTGGIAHDFNNLLTVVISSMEMLERRLAGGDPRTLRLVENALQGARRGAELTQRLLAFARRQRLEPTAVDLEAALRGMADLLGRSLGPEIAIETRVAPGLPPALVDAVQFETALLNLAVNARDAMPEGGRLLIEADEAPAGTGLIRSGGRFLRVAVTDTGIGMDAETLGRVLEPFFTTKGVGRGTGLGLSMVQGLAAQSGGSFQLRSRPGEGTRAEIILPVAPEDAAPAPAEAPPAALPPSSEPLTVLAVDDDALVRMGTVDMLEELGHAVVEAGSADAALRLLAEREVDVVVTDHAMPGMTGLQLAGRIAALRPGLPVVLASGYVEIPAGDAAPLAARLSKPFTQRQLAQVLDEARRRAPPAAATS